ncbi:MAG: hypothetical protein IPL26_14555 [Leptospiraceae bacterium]|nr:hypothetical protein [Leptospiraceae bacterium]
MIDFKSFLDHSETAVTIAKDGNPAIISVTAYHMAGDDQKFISEGYDGYVSKPINFKILSEMIRSCCDKIKN